MYRVKCSKAEKNMYTSYTKINKELKTIKKNFYLNFKCDFMIFFFFFSICNPDPYLVPGSNCGPVCINYLHIKLKSNASIVISSYTVKG